MDILHLLQIQSKLVPEMLAKFNSRFELLVTIKNNQPIGRKALMNFIDMTERGLRTECENLSNLGLITKKTTGMSLSDKGEEFLEEIKNFFAEENFDKERALIRKKFSIKDVFVVSGDFVNNEITKVEMANLLLDKVNAKITKDCVVGVSGGSTMHYVATKTDKRFGYGKKITFTPIRGGLSVDNTEYQANDIAANMANNSNHSYQLLHVPDDISSKAAEELIKEPVVKNALDIIEKTSIIIHSIGNAFEMAFRRKSSYEALQILQKEKAISESFGSYFNEEGRVIFKTSTIGMSFEDVQNIDNVFTIVGGEEKWKAVYSYLQTKPSNSILIIDEAICNKIITKVNKS